MEKIPMRSRMLPDLTNWEIERYLERNDLILIPVGNCEVHGAWPVDCEYVHAMAYAQLIARETDALVLPGMNYFHPGATQTGRGTVHMSMTDGLSYCLAIAHSLLDQGFRRQVWIPSHPPTGMFLLAMVTQFFDETHVPALYLDLMRTIRNKGFLKGGPDGAVVTSDGRTVHPFDDCMLAGYKLLGRLNAVPAKGEVDFPPVTNPKPHFGNHWFPEYDILEKCGNFGAPAGFYLPDANDHGGYPAAEFTREEMEQRADAGIRFILDVIEAVNFGELFDVLGRLGDLVRDVVLPKNYSHLPKTKNGYLYR